MADISDVQNALVAAIAQVVYPNGTSLPSATGAPTRIYAGWPQSSQLDKDLAGFANGGTGYLHVTVFGGGPESNTTRYSTDLQPVSITNPTLTMTIAGQTVTIAGTIAVPQNVALLVNGTPYTYAVHVNDTLASIATALAAQVAAASSAGAMITLAAGSRISAARAGGSGLLSREVARQKKIMQMTVWADTPDRRDALGKAINVAFSATNFLMMPDGSSARMVYVSSKNDDGSQRANLYRRDLNYSVEYATTQIVTATGVVVVQETIQTGVTGVAANLSTKTLYQ